MKKIMAYLLIPVLLLVLYVVGVLIYATMTDFQPDEITNAATHSQAHENIAPADSTFSFTIWNIGYGGLGAEMDFFYDKGKMVRPTAELSQKYIDGIVSQTAKFTGSDFVLLQEVDMDGKRSRGRNQFKLIDETLPQHSFNIGINYKVKYIPKPWTRPMGRVKGGLGSWSRFSPVEATRHQFPSSYGWPTRLFFLDRCFLTQRFDLANGKQLVVINTHNSAYDDGSLKADEMNYLRTFLEAEYAKGNFIVVGGDWNQCPPDFEWNTFKKDEEDYTQTNVDADYIPGWQWAYDGTTPTNRKVATPYVSGETFRTVIDFFLLSPNLEVVEVKGEDLDFAWSDHQPVHLKVRLK